MSQESYEECLEAELENAVKMHREKTYACIDYLKIIDMYSKKIRECGNIKDTKEWAERMIDHALQVK